MNAEFQTQEKDSNKQVRAPEVAAPQQSALAMEDQSQAAFSTAMNTTDAGARMTRGAYGGLEGIFLKAALQADRGGVSGRDPHEIAASGLSGSSQTLPHFDVIQKAFGHHDVSGIEAHVGGPARDAAHEMGALAFATGNKVAFDDAPTLHTAAHEAAHVIQQRAGVSLASAVGQQGDAYEQHADAVADAVVRGESAQPLLDQYVTQRKGGDAVQLLRDTGVTGNAPIQLWPFGKKKKGEEYQSLVEEDASSDDDFDPVAFHQAIEAEREAEDDEDGGKFYGIKGKHGKLGIGYEAEADAGLNDEGLHAEAGIRLFAGGELKAEGSTAWTSGGAKVSAEGKAKVFAGAEIEGEAGIEASTESIGAHAKLGAFAGLKAELEGEIGLEIGGRKLARIGGNATLTFGVGAEASLEFKAGLDGVVFDVKLEITLGFGFEIGFKVELHPKEIAGALSQLFQVLFGIGKKKGGYSQLEDEDGF